MALGTHARILVIRRDNIGDLVCTIPLIRALRSQLPDAHLAALVTRYNAPVLAGNPDLDALYSYTKAKHRDRSESLLGIYFQRLKLVGELRAQRFDWVLLPGGAQPSSLRLARLARTAQVLVRDERDDLAGAHEVEQSCHLLARMQLRYEAPPARLAVDPGQAAIMLERMRGKWGERPPEVIGLHISARKTAQRWPIDRFAQLARRLQGVRGARIVLLWAPGGADNPLHPGDDDKAQALCAAIPDVPVLALRTERLEELIAALAQCDRVICSDGGAMHLAAALGKPIVCLFGNSSAARWHPWGVPYELLHAASRDVRDIPADDVLAAHARLLERLSAGEPARAT